MNRIAIAALAPFLLCTWAAGQGKKNPVALTPEKAGADWQVQGEYIGKGGGGAALGAEVIARGGGKFDVNFLPGGLRGEGGNYKKRISGRATTNKDTVQITGKNCSATISEGVLAGKLGDFGDIRLKKVIRKSKTLGRKPPKGAVVLYSGPESVKNWSNPKTHDGNLLCYGCVSKQRFADHKIHLEFRLSYMPTRRGQGRSNSGVYVQGRYEIQVLDSFGLSGKSNECGGIYSVGKPKVNMCYPPLTWQTYDIDFRAARYDESGKKIKNAVITVKHNGVIIHDRTELKRGSTGGSKLKESPAPGPLYLQGHGGQLQYRNVWVVETKR